MTTTSASTTIEPTRLPAARAALDATEEALATISRRMRELDAAAQRRRAEADKANVPRQEKRGLLARILRRGDEATQEEAARLKEIDAMIASAQLAAGADADELQVIAEIQAELQRDADELHAQRKPLFVALAEAQFEAARAEIADQAMPEFIAAAEAFRLAYGRLVGLGKAHCQMAEYIKERHGSSPGATLGHPWPNTEPQLFLLGFPVEDILRGHKTVQGSNYTRVTLAAGEVVNQTAAEASARWLAA